MSVMQDVSWVEVIVIIGILVSTASSALGSMFGGSRVLQAVARDKLFPCLQVFCFVCQETNKFWSKFGRF